MSTKPAIAISIPALVAPDFGEGDDALDRAEDESGELDVIRLVRQRLDLDDDVADVAIAASIAAIVSRDDQRGRWLAAFGSPLGRVLAARGQDLNVAVSNLVALAMSRAS